MNGWSRLALAAAATAALSGCAGMYTQDGTPNDPWEGFNRGVFRFNDTLDRYALRPVAQGYDAVTPQPVQDGVGNFFSNLSEVGNMANGVLQGNPAIFGASLGRFLINTTLGLGGFLDPATGLGIEQRDEDFGKTFAAWGANSGPFVMLPLLGPSTVRDTAGLPGDWYVSVTRHIEDNYVRWGLRFIDVVNTRAGYLDQEQLIHGDRYTFIRDAWMQRRQFEIDGGQGADPFASGDFDYQEPEPAPDTPSQ
ncbi:MlaA family lipoprotein [Halotalea alkalilenta]|uniref:MlaA family lipoprotein n=1 Tax=Halotalea alkalilenta TaxID=376489 RepID=UPI000480BEF7|nr:VacJ family lipoprotein [Halotalea alkalilenta]